MTNNPNATSRTGFNASAGRYVDLATGRFVSRDDVFDQVDRAIESFKLNGQDYIRGAMQSGASVQSVQRALMVEIKMGYINAYVAGRGGLAQMTPRDWGIIGREVRRQYEFAARFMQDIASGRMSAAQIAYRWGLYYDKMVHGYWKGDQETQKRAGKTEMMRTLNSAVPCGDCPSYANVWRPIGELPLPTEACECKAKCLCGVEYR